MQSKEIFSWVASVQIRTKRKQQHGNGDVNKWSAQTVYPRFPCVYKQPIDNDTHSHIYIQFIYRVISRHTSWRVHIIWKKKLLLFSIPFLAKLKCYLSIYTQNCNRSKRECVCMDERVLFSTTAILLRSFFFVFFIFSCVLSSCNYSNGCLIIL